MQSLLILHSELLFLTLFLYSLYLRINPVIFLSQQLTCVADQKSPKVFYSRYNLRNLSTVIYLFKVIWGISVPADAEIELCLLNHFTAHWWCSQVGLMLDRMWGCQHEVKPKIQCLPGVWIFVVHKCVYLPLRKWHSSPQIISPWELPGNDACMWY